MAFFRIIMLSVLLVMPWEASSQSPPQHAPEKSQSPFHRSPSAVAMEDTCRYIGTYHKESRQRLEELRANEVITLDEWKCMARALAALDDELTLDCKKVEKSIEAIEAEIRFRLVLALSSVETRQSELYAPCLSPPNPKVVACSLLSSEDRCFVVPPPNVDLPAGSKGDAPVF